MYRYIQVNRNNIQENSTKTRVLLLYTCTSRYYTRYRVPLAGMFLYKKTAPKHVFSCCIPVGTILGIECP